MTIAAATGTENNSGGNGQFTPLRRNIKNNNRNYNTEVFNLNDPRMRFRNSIDPIYVAYDYLENQSISSLATSFVKESVSGIFEFVSKVVKG